LTLSLNSVQALTSETITFNKNLACSECIRGGFTYAYYKVWDETSSASYFTNVNFAKDRCWGPSTTAAIDQPTGTKTDKYLSTSFTNKDYAVFACPQSSTHCGGQKTIVYEKKSDYTTAPTRSMDLTNTKSCGWALVGLCDLPQVSIKAITGVTAADVEVTVMEHALDETEVTGLTAKYDTTYVSQSKYKYPTGYEDYYVAPTSNKWSAMGDLTAFDAANTYVGKFKTSATELATQTGYITTFNTAYSTYTTALTKYKTDLITYQGTYTTMLTEVWDDFIGVPRVEGKEADRAKLGTKPTAPTFPTMNKLYAAPASADFVCLGKPCSADIPIAAANAKNFGVFGLKSTTADTGFDLNGSSLAYGIKDKKADALAYSMTTCRPKIMYVTANVKKTAYTAGAGAKIDFTFSLQTANAVAKKAIGDAVFIPKIDPKATAVVLPGDADVTKFQTFYKANGSSSLMASMTAAGAALIAMTLY